MGDVAQGFDRRVLTAGHELLAGFEPLADQGCNGTARRAIVHAEEHIHIATVASQAVLGKGLCLDRIPVGGVLLAHDLDFAGVDQRLEEFVLSGFVLTGAVFALIAFDASNLHGRLVHLADQLGGTLALCTAHRQRIEDDMCVRLAAHRVMVVQYDGHFGCGRGCQAARREVCIRGGVDNHLGALRDRVLDQALLTRRVTLSILDNDLRLRGSFLHRFHEERRITAFETDGGGVRQQEEHLVFRHRGGSNAGHHGSGHDSIDCLLHACLQSVS